MNAKLIKTCDMCPEQYELINESGDIIAYMRLRWGSFTVECPDVGGKVVHSCEYGDEYKGEFNNQQERETELREAIKKIEEHYGYSLITEGIK